MGIPKLAASLLTAAAVASAAGAGTTPTPPASSASVFVVTGRGWGHGVGLSQWGAYGMARRGAQYAAILAHYYRGTTLGRAPVARVRVLLADGRKTVTVGSAAPFTVRDASGQMHELVARRVAFGTGLRLDVDGTGPAPLRGPLTFSPTSAPLELGGRRYRGTFEVAVAAGRLRVVNGVRLEQYLWGVVPDEMPDEWPAEALKAQAVVARSYALAVRRTGPFDLYADVRSQVYGGVASEERSTTAAVNATAGQVLLHGGKVATTFFFSTSGGRTANVEDVWGGRPSPYLVSVPDPHDSASPHHRWGPIVVTAQQMARALGAGESLLDVRTTRNRSGRAAQVIGVTSRAELGVTAAWLREKLGLRSTWFTVGVLRLDRPPKTVIHGARVRLTGLARGLAGVTLEERRPGGSWTRGAAAPRVAGTGLTVDVRALSPAEYRLASGAARTPAVRLSVAPLVRLAAVGRRALRGSVRPAVPGAAVTIEHRAAGGAWRRVAGAIAGEGGTFAVPLALAPGSYRARAVVGGGFATGLSASLAVTAP